MDFHVAKYFSLWCPHCKSGGDIFGPATCPECGASREPQARVAGLEQDVGIFLEYALAGTLGIDEGGMLAATWGVKSTVTQYLRSEAVIIFLRYYLETLSPRLVGALRELGRVFQGSKAFSSALYKIIMFIERKNQDVQGILAKTEKGMPLDPVTDLTRRYTVAYTEHQKLGRTDGHSTNPFSNLDTLLLERDELVASLAKVSSIKDAHTKFRGDFANIPAKDLPLAISRGEEEFAALLAAVSQLFRTRGG